MFMDPLKEAATAQPRPLVNIKDVETIFAYIPELIALSSAILRRLHETVHAIESNHSCRNCCSCGVGKVFCEYLNRFDIYISYAANFAKAQRCATKKANANIVCRQLMQVNDEFIS